MKFKVGDKVRFKKTIKIPTSFLTGKTGEFHIAHEDKVATITDIGSYGDKTHKSKYNKGFRLDIDKKGRFLFHVERFEKVNSINIDDNLFKL